MSLMIMSNEEDLDKLIEDIGCRTPSKLEAGLVFVGWLLVLCVVGYCLFVPGGSNLLVHEVSYVNVSENVVGKEIVYDSGFMAHDNHYFVFTDTCCFDVPLVEYNKLKVGDKVVISRLSDEDSGGSLILGEYRYRDCN